ncbi:AraC family transcriptional regulator [Pseudomonas sp. MPC6]|uniref:AraC family transcriptional regulator n=1 Tax=unclassified Pseudomonas TaxID=196821 RepID=UPI0011104620|nr:AraC family transcriptional regulator [Pseudomonas sp. MPC6]QCY09454.1 AraC family transcriptional regulator [Pseudomonas sp. MPC6]
MSPISDPRTSVNEVVLPTQVVAIFADVIKEKGFTDLEVLAGTGLLPQDLRQQNTFIRYDQVLRIVENALALYPEPGLGLVVGQREKVSTWGLLGFAIMSSATLKSALEVTHDYYQSGPALYDMEFHFTPDHCVMQAYTPHPIGSLLPTVIEELFACVYAVFPVLIGKPFKARKIEVAFDKPAYSLQYDRLFRCPIHFNSPSNRMIFDAQYLDCPLVTADSISAQLSRTLCVESLQRQGQVTDLCYSIRRILGRTPGRFPSMDLVAEELKMSTRSLRRYLTEHNTSFQNLADDVRAHLAIDYLSNSNISLDEVAERVGFSEYSNFRKAFKHWTGHPPSHYRN